MVFSILPDNKKELFHCLVSLPEFFCCCLHFFGARFGDLNSLSTSVFPSSFASSSELHIKGGLKEIPHKRSESALEKNQQKHQTYASILIVAFLLQMFNDQFVFCWGKVHNCLKLTEFQKKHHFSIPFFQLGRHFFYHPKKAFDFSGQQNGADFCLVKMVTRSITSKG